MDKQRTKTPSPLIEADDEISLRAKLWARRLAEIRNRLEALMTERARDAARGRDRVEEREEARERRGED